MYKNFRFLINNCNKYMKIQTKNKNININETRQKFIRDKLDNILSPATKDYLKLKKEMQNELKTHNKTFKHKTR